jgi:hypothetical protein
MSSTKQTKHSNPLLTRRAALTTPPGALFRNGGFRVRSPVLQAISRRVVASI